MSADRTPSPCGNCGHAYGLHNGQSYMPSGGIGPKDRAMWGAGCSFPEDSRHTCPCGRWFAPDDPRVRGGRFAAICNHDGIEDASDCPAAVHL